MKTVAIIGLGWLGKPLAQKLLDQGYLVVGSTTSVEKQKQLASEGLNSVLFELKPFLSGVSFQTLFDCEILIINIPPKTRTSSGDFYLEQLKYLRSRIDQSAIRKVIYISSTGVYPKEERSNPYTEEEPINHENSGNPVLLKAEHLILRNASYDCSIIRFGGLMGDGRIPGNNFAGKEDVVGHTRVNFIHQNDAVNLIKWIIEEGYWNQLFNGVAPVHPKRKELYEKNAEELGLKPPKNYQKGTVSLNREISANALLEAGFKFEFPDPLDFKY